VLAPPRIHLQLVSRVAASAPDSPPSWHDDAQLLALVRAGEPRAADALHDRVRPRVDQTLYRLIGSHDNDHADLAQQSLIEIVTTIDHYRGEGTLDAWISTVTAHVVYKHTRRRQLERRLFQEMLYDDDARLATDRMVTDATARASLQRIGALLSTMDQQRVWAFMIHDVFGYDMRETAQVLGVSAAAAQSRLARGRKQLHELIAADPDLASLMLTFKSTDDQLNEQDD
jgi:RNA polymerase sigma-70 factor (ECF subfamily)